MIDGKILTEKLIRYAEKFLHLNGRDKIYFRNLLLREFNLDEPFNDKLDLSLIDTLEVPGRHDVCFALRAPVVVEAMAAIALADLAICR